MTLSAGSTPGPPVSWAVWPRRSAALAAAGAFATSGVLYFRTLHTFHTPFLEILLWQAVAWLPWVVASALGPRPLDWCLEPVALAGVYLRVGFAASLAGGAAAVWMRLVSERWSPYLGAVGTHLGVFRLFFLSWFVVQALLFTVLVGWRLLVLSRGDRELVADDDESARSASGFERADREGESGGLLELADGASFELAAVLWIEAQDYYSAVHTLGGGTHLVRQSMSSLEDALEDRGFVRSHRSALVNLAHLDRITRRGTHGRSAALLTDGTVCPVSRTGLRSLRSAKVRWR